MGASTEFKTINTKLTASPAGLDAGLKSAEGKLKGFGDRVKGLFSGGGFSAAFSGGFLGGIAGTAGIAAFGKVKDFLEDTLGQGQKALAMEKQARSVGFSGAGLSAFDRLKPGGAEAMQPLLVKMNKTVGEAAMGSEEAAKKLKMIGISVDEVRGKSPEQVYERIADAISKIPGKAERTAAAIEILGKSGAEALPLLEKGAGAFEAARLKQVERGVAPPTELVAATEAYNRAAANLRQAWEGGKNRTANNLAPIIDAGAGFLNNLAGIFDDMSAVADLLPPEWGGSAGQGRTLGSQGDAANVKLWQSQRKAAEEAKRAGEADKAHLQSEAFGAVEKEVTAMERLNQTFGMTSEEVKRFDLGTKLKEAGIDQTARGMEDLARAARAVQQATDNINLKKITDALETPAQKFADQLGQAGGLFSRGRLGANDFGRFSLHSFEDLERQFGGPAAARVNVASAIDPNSAAGASALLRAGNTESPRTLQQRANELLEKMRLSQEQEAKDVADMADLMRNGTVDLIIASAN